eukprot:gene15522-biopygen3675
MAAASVSWSVLSSAIDSDFYLAKWLDWRSGYMSVTCLELHSVHSYSELPSVLRSALYSASVRTMAAASVSWSVLSSAIDSDFYLAKWLDWRSGYMSVTCLELHSVHSYSELPSVLRSALYSA